AVVALRLPLAAMTVPAGLPSGLQMVAVVRSHSRRLGRTRRFARFSTKPEGLSYVRRPCRPPAWCLPGPSRPATFLPTAVLGSNDQDAHNQGSGGKAETSLPPAICDIVEVL